MVCHGGRVSLVSCTALVSSSDIAALILFLLGFAALMLVWELWEWNFWGCDTLQRIYYSTRLREE
jgi:hypothetical protein